MSCDIYIYKLLLVDVVKNCSSYFSSINLFQLMSKDYYRVSCIKTLMSHLTCKMIFFNAFTLRNAIYHNAAMPKIFTNLLIANTD